MSQRCREDLTHEFNHEGVSQLSRLFVWLKHQITWNPFPACQVCFLVDLQWTNVFERSSHSLKRHFTLICALLEQNTSIQAAWEFWAAVRSGGDKYLKCKLYWFALGADLFKVWHHFSCLDCHQFSFLTTNENETYCLPMNARKIRRSRIVKWTMSWHYVSTKTATEYLQSEIVLQMSFHKNNTLLFLWGNDFLWSCTHGKQWNGNVIKT